MHRGIIDYLQSVEISHSFAMNYNHGVQSINSNGNGICLSQRDLFTLFSH